MKKKHAVYLIAFILLALIVPTNISAKEKMPEKVICKYQYQNEYSKELTYKIYANDVVVSFEDAENNWYHEPNFEKNFLESAKINSINYVCPTIAIEETQHFTTVFNNTIKDEDCNGKCTTLIANQIIAQDNITVKKAVATTAIGSVGIYKDEKYFVPYFRLLDDGTKEWSVNGKKFISTDENAIIKINEKKQILIKLDEILVNKIFKNEKLNHSVKIYRNVRKLKNNTYEYLLSTKQDKNYTLKDGQEKKASAYKAAYGNQLAQDTSGWLDGYDQQQDCSGHDSLLGSYNDEDSVAWILQKIFTYVKLIGPFIVVVASGVDFAKVIVMGDDDGMKKAQSKLIVRLILAASLFFLPDLVSAMLELFGITSSGICGLK